MEKVFLTIINGVLNSMTTSTIEDSCDPKQRIENALKYFGIRELDVEWDKQMETVVPNQKYPLITKIGTVRGTSKIITISYYECK